MRYTADWVHPARTTEQARCAGPNCNPGDLPGVLVMACTLDDNGFCAKCARTPADDHTLRLNEQGETHGDRC